MGVKAANPSGDRLCFALPDSRRGSVLSFPSALLPPALISGLMFRSSRHLRTLYMWAGSCMDLRKTTVRSFGTDRLSGKARKLVGTRQGPKNYINILKSFSVIQLDAVEVYDLQADAVPSRWRQRLENADRLPSGFHWSQSRKGNPTSKLFIISEVLPAGERSTVGSYSFGGKLR